MAVVGKTILNLLMILVTLCMNVNSNDIQKRLLQANNFTDLWGYTVDWTNKEDGWNDEKRELYLGRNARIYTLAKKVPEYTLDGYRKLKIPGKLYLRILQARSSSKLEPEKCLIPNSVNNCYRVKNELTIPMKSGQIEVLGETPSIL